MLARISSDAGRKQRECRRLGFPDALPDAVFLPVEVGGKGRSVFHAIVIKACWDALGNCSSKQDLSATNRTSTLRIGSNTALNSSIRVMDAQSVGSKRTTAILLSSWPQKAYRYSLLMMLFLIRTLNSFRRVGSGLKVRVPGLALERMGMGTGAARQFVAGVFLSPVFDS
jgi:hypothetical protein